MKASAFFQAFLFQGTLLCAAEKRGLHGREGTLTVDATVDCKRPACWKRCSPSLYLPLTGPSLGLPGPAEKAISQTILVSIEPLPPAAMKSRTSQREHGQTGLHDGRMRVMAPHSVNHLVRILPWKKNNGIKLISSILFACVI